MNTVWRVRLLGGLRAERGGEVVTRFRSQKFGALLAYLALFPQRAHTREELADMLWPDAEPEAARTNLRTALSSLRRQLEPPGTPAGSVLVTPGHGEVGLNPAAFETDVDAFEKALKAAARHGTPPDEAARLLADAADLYAGPLLSGYYETWVLTERDRLAEAHLDALRRLVVYHEQVGEPERALGFARRAVSADPLSEEAHASIIRLLMATGQPAAARRQFVELTRLLDEQLGAEPSPETRALLDAKAGPTSRPVAPQGTTFGVARNARVSGGEDEATRAEQGPPAEPFPPAVSLHLPLTFTRFFGREQEMSTLRTLLVAPAGTDGSGNCCLVTLTGPGGSGKTRLAIETARQLAPSFTGGVWFVPLADVRESEHIGGALADALGLSRSPSVPPLEQAIEALCARSDVARGAVLLVLDNFEQLVDNGGANAVQELLAHVPALTCLVTSRQRLLLEGEQEFPVQPLPAPDATGAPTNTPERLLGFPSVQLFVDRARAARPDFQLSPRNAESVAGLCSKLEGVPLAIELAAAWAQTLTPVQMRDRLAQRFNLLVARRRDAPGRHRSLRAAIEWGWELLSPEARGFFSRLSVFRGGWTLEAAEVITGRSDALMLLTELCDRSFLQTEEAQDAVGGDGGEQMRFRMLETLREFAHEQVGGDADRAALSDRHYQYFLRLTERAEPHLYRPDQALWLRRLEAEHDNLRAALAGALEREPRRALRLAAALNRFWEVHSHVREASVWVERALASIPAEASLLRARALDQAGTFAWYLRDFGRMRARLEESIALYRRLGDDGVAGPLDHLAALPLMVENNPAEARALLEEALRATERSGDDHQKREVVFSLSRAALIGRDFAEAERYAQEWLRLAEMIGDRSSAVGALSIRGMIVINLGEYDRSRRYFEAALARGEGLGETFWTSGAVFGLGVIAVLEGDYEAARALLGQSQRMIGATGFDYVKHYVLEAQACRFVGEGDTRRGARLLGALEHLKKTAQVVSASIFHDCFASFVTMARETLGEEAFAQEKAAGAALTLEQALAYALEERRENEPPPATRT